MKTKSTDLFGKSLFKNKDGSYSVGGKKKPVQHEAILHRQVCKFMNLKFPDIIYTSDLASGMKLSMGQAIKAKKMRSSRALPDLYILASRRGYSGLFLELKKEDEIIFLQNGDLSKDKHVREQNEILKRLCAEGYLARFCIGYKQATEVIEWYFST